MITQYEAVIQAFKAMGNREVLVRWKIGFLDIMVWLLKVLEQLWQTWFLKRTEVIALQLFLKNIGY